MIIYIDKFPQLAPGILFLYTTESEPNPQDVSKNIFTSC